jgi:anti-sigma B factor antagonist
VAAAFEVPGLGHGFEGFGISVEDDGVGPPVVQLRGDVDITCAAALGDCLSVLTARGGDVVVELTSWRFIDSTGMGALVRGRNLAKQRGADLRLRHPTSNVRKTLALAGLDKVFEIEV